jgi:hypothetical protein
VRVPRKNPELNDRLQILDEKFIEAQRLSKTDLEVVPRAWDMLNDDELLFITDETGKCLTDRRYFMENYYVIRNERGQLQTLYPFLDFQNTIYDVVEEEWTAKGCCRLIILKPRQTGSTTWNAALIFHGTIFVPNTFSIAMAQDAEVSGEIYQRIISAYHALPWFIRPEYLSKQQGKQVIFQREDEGLRNIDPGLGSTLMISNAQKAAGVAIGRSIRNGLFSEVSRWPDATVWSSDIKPSLNAPDMLGIMESTAFGRSGLYWNMWRAAEAGKSIWRALFLPVYHVRKYFIPVTVGEPFTLTPEEKALRLNVKSRENFTIPLGFFKWRRADLIETVNSTGSEETHYESYPVTSGEAFISSGFCAFSRKELSRQERVNCCDPKWIGEIEYVGQELTPILHLHEPLPEELIDISDRHNRLWVWEKPEPESSQVEYYLGNDVGAGNEGNDYSSAIILRLGYGPNPDVQVAEWHGHANPTHLARMIAAIGQWYNMCEIAVEYQASGITVGNELQWNLDYPVLYRWRVQDKISNTLSSHVHWLTNSRTRDDAINRAGEKLLDHMIVIRNKHLIEEMRDFGRLEGELKAQALSAHDDRVLALLICIGASVQTGKRQEMTDQMSMGVSTSTAAGVMPRGTRYTVFDHFSRMVADVGSLEEGNKLIADTERIHNVKLKGLWSVKEIVPTRCNTPWSPIWDSQGAARELYDQGMEPRDIMTGQNIVEVYKQMLTAQRHAGTGADTAGDADIINDEDF